MSRTSEGRMRYTVKTGDTPVSIAGRILGDVRYAGLLVTINRVHTVHDENPAAETRFQMQSRIDLPSDTEMQIYSRHYFTAWAQKKSWFQESATSVSTFLEKMREAAQRGAERLGSNSVQVSRNSNSKMRSSFISQNQTDFQPEHATASNGIQMQQSRFDAFINGRG